MKHAVDPNGTLRSIDAVLTDNLRWRAKAAFDRLLPHVELCHACASLLSIPFVDGCLPDCRSRIPCGHRQEHPVTADRRVVWRSGEPNFGNRIEVDGIAEPWGQRHHAMVELWVDDPEDDDEPVW